MKLTEAKKRYDKKYKASKVDRFYIDLYPTDKDIKEFLELISQKMPKATYVKNIIRTNIKAYAYANKLLNEMKGGKKWQNKKINVSECIRI